MWCIIKLMTSTVTTITIAAIMSSDYGALSNGGGFIVISLVFVLLIEKALLDAYGGTKYKKRTKVFNVAVAPLLIVFCFVVILHFAQIVHLF